MDAFVVGENGISENGSMWPAQRSDAMGNSRVPREVSSKRFRDARVSGNNGTVAEVSRDRPQPPCNFHFMAEIVFEMLSAQVTADCALFCY